MKTHEIVTWPGDFQAVWDGIKTAEFRWKDQRFEAGEQIVLHEWDPGSEGYTDRAIMALITHVADDPRSGIPDGYAMLSIQPHTLLGSEDRP